MHIVFTYINAKRLQRFDLKTVVYMRAPAFRGGAPAGIIRFTRELTRMNRAGHELRLNTEIKNTIGSTT